MRESFRKWLMTLKDGEVRYPENGCSSCAIIAALFDAILSAS
jgi:hypothetical protein